MGANALLGSAYHCMMDKMSIANDSRLCVSPIVEENQTFLFNYLKHQQWTEALNRLHAKPLEAKVWITEEENPHVKQYKKKILRVLLPLHASIILGAPPYLILEILNAYPSAAREKDPRGSLPIHLAAARIDTDLDGERVVHKLMEVYFESTTMKDSEGHTPIELAYAAQLRKEKMVLTRQEEVDALSKIPEDEGFELEFKTNNGAWKDDVGCSMSMDELTWDGSKSIDSTILDTAGSISEINPSREVSLLSMSWLSLTPNSSDGGGNESQCNAKSSSKLNGRPPLNPNHIKSDRRRPSLTSNSALIRSSKSADGATSDSKSEKRGVFGAIRLVRSSSLRNRSKNKSNQHSSTLSMSESGDYSSQDEKSTSNDSQYSKRDSKSASTMASGIGFLKSRTRSLEISSKYSISKSRSMDSKGSFRKDDDNTEGRSCQEDSRSRTASRDMANSNAVSNNLIKTRSLDLGAIVPSEVFVSSPKIVDKTCDTPMSIFTECSESAEEKENNNNIHESGMSGAIGALNSIHLVRSSSLRSRSKSKFKGSQIISTLSMSNSGDCSSQDEISTSNDSQSGKRDPTSALPLASGIAFLKSRTRSLDISSKGSLSKARSMDSKGSFGKNDDNEEERSCREDSCALAATRDAAAPDEVCNKFIETLSLDLDVIIPSEVSFSSPKRVDTTCDTPMSIFTEYSESTGDESVSLYHNHTPRTSNAGENKSTDNSSCSNDSKYSKTVGNISHRNEGEFHFYDSTTPISSETTNSSVCEDLMPYSPLPRTKISDVISTYPTEFASIPIKSTVKNTKSSTCIIEDEIVVCLVEQALSNIFKSSEYLEGFLKELKSNKLLTLEDINSADKKTLDSALSDKELSQEIQRILDETDFESLCTITEGSEDESTKC